MLYDYPVINMRDFVNSEDDLANDGMKGGTHFNRAVYKSVSDAIIESILITL